MYLQFFHLAASCLFLLQSKPAPPAPTGQEASLRAHVEKLTSSEMEGRGQSPGKDKARDYIVGEFTKLGLKTAGTLKSYVQEFKEPQPGKNVVALLPGSDPKLAQEFVIVSAHYDHKGKIGNQVFPGADDNASGVAAMLEVAHTLKEMKPAVKRSVLFIAFDLEEAGLLGSIAYAKQPPIPLANVALFTTMDMVGRPTYDIVDNYLFVMGVEHAEGARATIKKVFEGSTLKPGIIGTDLIGARSDFAAFAAQKIPYLFFSTGEHSDYHKPTDTADKIDFPKLTDNTQLIQKCIVEFANAPARLTWNEQKPDIDEMKAFAEVFHKFKENSSKLGLDEMTTGMLGNVCTQLDAIVKRGTVTPDDRKMLKTIVDQMISSMR